MPFCVFLAQFAFFAFVRFFRIRQKTTDTYFCVFVTQPAKLKTNSKKQKKPVSIVLVDAFRTNMSVDEEDCWGEEVLGCKRLLTKRRPRTKTTAWKAEDCGRREDLDRQSYRRDRTSTDEEKTSTSTECGRRRLLGRRNLGMQ